MYNMMEGMPTEIDYLIKNKPYLVPEVAAIQTNGHVYNHTILTEAE